MSQDPHSTHASLLMRVQDSQDEESWRTFTSIYGPLVQAFGRRKGLQTADAADLAQDVLATVHAAIKKFAYEPQKGSFRGWLFTITSNRLHDLARKRNREPKTIGASAIQIVLDQQSDVSADEEIWNREHEQHLFRWASDQVKDRFSPKTWKAFWLTSVEHLSSQQVAQRLEMSLGAVYIAKSRVLNQLRETIRTLEPQD